MTSLGKGAPPVDALTVMCQARAYVVRHENAEGSGIEVVLQH